MGVRDNNPEPFFLGWIPYWNLAPLKYELLRSWRGSLRFQSGHPNDVNRLLSEGVISLSPCSSVCLLQNPNNELAFPLGIASQGAVGSVFLGLRKDNPPLLDAIKTRQRMLREVVSHAGVRSGGDARQAAQFIWQACRDLAAPEVELSITDGKRQKTDTPCTILLIYSI